MIVPDCRVLTWNVWWRFGDWAARQPLIADVLNAAHADVIALQETWKTGRVGQPERLAAAAGLEHVAWSANRQPERWRQRVDDQPDDLECGLALLSRWPILDVNERVLPTGTFPSTGRTALGVLIEHPRGPLPVITTHLDSHPAHSQLRVAQLREVASLTQDLIQHAGPEALSAIVCGDMNADPESDEIRQFAGVLTAPFVDDLAFFDAWPVAVDDDPGWTWRKDNPYVEEGNPNARIDYVFVGLSARITSAELVGLGDGPAWPSDHAAVAVELRP